MRSFSTQKPSARSFRSRNSSAASPLRYAANAMLMTAQAVPGPRLAPDQGEQGPVCASCHKSHPSPPFAGAGSSAPDKTSACAVTQAIPWDRLRTVTRFLEGRCSGSGRVGPCQAGCYDCHFGFSSSQNPKRNFNFTPRFSIAQSEACRRCHFDKYTRPWRASTIPS